MSTSTLADPNPNPNLPLTLTLTLSITLTLNLTLSLSFLLSYPHGNKMKGYGSCALIITISDVCESRSTPIENIKELENTLKNTHTQKQQI